MRQPDFIVLNDPPSLPEALAGPVLAIGNFDGVHRGHKQLLAGARIMAERLGAPTAVLTFEPHPRVHFRPEEPHFSLASAADKARLLRLAGMAGMVTMRFDADLTRMGADAFVSDLLVRRLGVRGVAVGQNFRYGRGREGDAARLADDGRRMGFETLVLDSVTSGGRVVSSTAVRQALAAGDVAGAGDLLGHWWFVTAPVAHGDKRGRELGYPTANMILDPTCGLAHGIYAVRAEVEGKVHDGVASFGRRPTFDDGAPRLESFLFDFSGDLYGRTMSVEFVARIRGEEKFDSVAALVERMDRDAAQARDILAAPPTGAGGSIASALGG